MKSSSALLILYGAFGTQASQSGVFTLDEVSSQISSFDQGRQIGALSRIGTHQQNSSCFGCALAVSLWPSLERSTSKLNISSAAFSISRFQERLPTQRPLNTNSKSLNTGPFNKQPLHQSVASLLPVPQKSLSQSSLSASHIANSQSRVEATPPFTELRTSMAGSQSIWSS